MPKMDVFFHDIWRFHMPKTSPNPSQQTPEHDLEPPAAKSWGLTHLAGYRPDDTLPLHGSAVLGRAAELIREITVADSHLHILSIGQASF